MKKIIFILLAVLVCRTGVYAESFNFSLANNNTSNEILSDYIKSNFSGFRGDVVSHYYDIDNDGENEIIGIAKSKLFYNLEGYKLIVLKKQNENWNSINSNIYFNPSFELDIDKNKVTYYKTSYNKFSPYKIKKCQDKISNKIENNFRNNIIENSEKADENIYYVSEGISGIELDISSISIPVQRTVKIQYKDLSDKTKHYLEIK